MRLWGRKPHEETKVKLPPGTWDFHAHILPGVDDGLRTYEEADAAIIALMDLGYAGLVLTPHIYPEVFANTEESLRTAFATFQTHVGTRIKLKLAAEYFVHEAMLPKIARQEILWVQAGVHKLVLVEFPVVMAPPRGMEILTALRVAGYQPVLAHIERYRYVQQQLDQWLAQLRQAEIWVQCDLGSLVGQYGREPQKAAQRLYADDRVDIWGTDLHRVEQVERYMGPALTICTERRRLNASLE